MLYVSVTAPGGRAVRSKVEVINYLQTNGGSKAYQTQQWQKYMRYVPGTSCIHATNININPSSDGPQNHLRAPRPEQSERSTLRLNSIPNTDISAQPCCCAVGSCCFDNKVPLNCVLEFPTQDPPLAVFEGSHLTAGVTSKWAAINVVQTRVVVVRIKS